MEMGKPFLMLHKMSSKKDPFKFQTVWTWWAILSVFPREIIASQYWNDVDSEEEQREDPHLSDSRKMNVYKDKANTLTLVATLIATVTSAAERLNRESVRLKLTSSKPTKSLSKLQKFSIEPSNYNPKAAHFVLTSIPTKFMETLTSFPFTK